jgi:hypothetical protein
VSLQNHSSNPGFRLNLQTLFPDLGNQKQNDHHQFSVSTHPSENSFLVSNGFMLTHLIFPEGFEDPGKHQPNILKNSKSL